MTSPEAWKPRSCLLDRLPGDVCTRLAPHLQLVELPVGKVLMESGPGNASPCSHAYFLRSGTDEMPIEYRVKRDLDGRSFSNRRVVASQRGWSAASRMESQVR